MEKRVSSGGFRNGEKQKSYLFHVLKVVEEWFIRLHS